MLEVYKEFVYGNHNLYCAIILGAALGGCFFSNTFRLESIKRRVFFSIFDLVAFIAVLVLLDNICASAAFAGYFILLLLYPFYIVIDKLVDLLFVWVRNLISFFTKQKTEDDNNDCQ